MKILYALQASGNSHISRANEIIPVLEKYCEVDILLSGSQAEVGLNHYIKFRRKGINILYARNGTIELVKTIRQLKSKKFIEMASLIPVEDYDAVINDFEPLSAWACKRKNIPCIALSHYYAVIDASAPKALKNDPMGWLLLRYFAPVTFGLGLHFKSYDRNIFTPVIRSEIRNAYIRNLGHYTVYLPEVKDKKIINILSKFRNTQWHIFSRDAARNYSIDNCWIRPISNYDFISSSTTCEGILCAAGFETAAEAIFMNKKLMVVPMKGRYEQQCNAAALRELGVPVLKKFSRKKSKLILAWLKSSHKIHIPYHDEMERMVRELLNIISLAQRQASITSLIEPALLPDSYFIDA